MEAAFSHHGLSEFTDDRSKDLGGEPAANPLQPAGSSRHAMTLDAEVEGTITASPMVERWPYLFSQSSYQRRPCGTLPYLSSVEEHP